MEVTGPELRVIRVLVRHRFQPKADDVNAWPLIRIEAPDNWQDAVKSSHSKDAASHHDPESCGPGRKAQHEALTGAGAGEVSNREIRTSGSPTLLSEAEGNMTVNAKASSPADPRGC
jgi:hypothetical protein